MVPSLIIGTQNVAVICADDRGGTKNQDARSQRAQRRAPHESVSSRIPNVCQPPPLAEINSTPSHDFGGQEDDQTKQCAQTSGHRPTQSLRTTPVSASSVLGTLSGSTRGPPLPAEYSATARKPWLAPAICPGTEMVFGAAKKPTGDGEYGGAYLDPNTSCPQS